VVDFIAVGRWPAFNVADAAMVCGVAAAVWSLA
jgi:lipoprotein signal peptidase